jgi:hypothetical protein
MTQEYGRTGDGMAALRVCLRPLLLITLGVIPMTVAGWLLLPPVVEWLLPKYVPGIAAAQWTLLSVAFLCVSQALSLFMVLRRMLAYGLVIGLGAAGFLATLPWLAEQNPDSPVTGVAQAMAVGVGIYLLAGNVIGVYIARQRGVAGMGGKVEP